MYNPLEHPVCFQQPRFLTPSTWLQHIPFAYALVELAKPKVLVELGTFHGDSYLAFCQSVAYLELPTKCYAVDTWKGDDHNGYYGEEVLISLKERHDRLYGQFSSLIRSTFDEAANHFSDGGIDLLHIDGFHTYEAVRHDFETWLPKLSNSAVVLFHDINVKERGFGVWKFWEELKTQHPCFEFSHGYGLGVAVVGKKPGKEVLSIVNQSDADRTRLQQFFAHMGQGISNIYQIQGMSGYQNQLKAEIFNLAQRNRELEAQLENVRQAKTEQLAPAR